MSGSGLLTERIEDLPNAINPSRADTIPVWQPGQSPHTRQMSLDQIQEAIGGLVDDAPRDNNVYGRVNASWVQVLPISGGEITGNLQVDGSFTVLGATTWNGSLTVVGPLIADTTLSVVGTTTLAGLVTTGSDIQVGGNVYIPTAPTTANMAANKAYVDAKYTVPPGNPTGPAGGSLAGSYPNPSLAATTVTPGTYTYSTVTVGADGRITAASSGAVGLPATPSGAAGGDLTGSYPNPTLATTTVTAGTYTLATITVNSKGQVTSASSGSAGSATPSGPAGGVLGGTYPNPTMASTTVVPGNYTNASITVGADGRLTAAANGTALASGSPSGPAGGSLSGTYPNPTLTSTGISPGAYTNTNLTVNTEGRITAISSGSKGGSSAVSSVGTSGAGITASPNPITGTGTITVQWNAGAVNTVGSGLSLSGGTLAASGGAPGGSAGGSLAGTYPNPTLAPTGVTAGSYTLSSITIAADGRITAASNGTAGSGTVTSVGSGTGLSGGPITASGTLTADWRVGVVTSLGTGLSLVSGTLSASSTGGGISDAPSDSTYYARTNSTWSHIPFSALIGTATYTQLPAEVQQVPVAFPFSGKPTASAQVNVPMAMALTVPASLSGTTGYQNTLATATATFTLNKISGGTTTALGTIAFGTSSHTTLTLSGAGGSLAVGDVLQIVAPSSQDATLADLGITILASRV